MAMVIVLGVLLAWALFALVLAGILIWETRPARRRDLVDEAAADAIQVVAEPDPVVERIREEALRDAAGAAFVTPGYRRLDGFLDELFERRPR